MPARAERGLQLPDRWTVERAVKSAPIPPIACHLVLVLCTYLDAGSTRVPYRFSPSITRLQRDTGWSRRSVTRWLQYLEDGGWLVRIRPTKEDARKKHKRTAYSLLVPDLGPEGPEARAAESPGLGPLNHQARAGESPELGPYSLEARAGGSHYQTSPDQPDMPDQDRSEIELVITQMHERTGVRVDVDQATKIRDLIVARPHADGTRRSYLIRTLVTDKHPERWLEEDL